MAEENIIIKHLQAIRATLDNHGQMLEDLRYRVSSVEQQVAGLRADFAHYSNRTDTL